MKFHRIKNAIKICTFTYTIYTLGGIFYINQRRKSSNQTFNKFESFLYHSLPLRLTSRFTGFVANLHVPVSCRKFVFGLFEKFYPKFTLEDADRQDFLEYESLSDLFLRKLIPESRPFQLEAIEGTDEKILKNFISPVDGTILESGEIEIEEGETFEIVKNQSYSFIQFFGQESLDISQVKSMLESKGVKLFHLIIYLSPHNYHRFHSPTKWHLRHRRHFVGKLLSVNPNVVRLLPNLFNYQERVLLTGSWEHGFFSFCAVGATNVGSISINIDRTLKTNQMFSFRTIFDKNFHGRQLLTSGEEIGRFNLGSTIVLIFTAPANYVFRHHSNDEIQLGEALMKEKEMGI
ncbi:hypothetical protein SNEBB_001911 [Seison nebaliae]|nr:hypothetical protein SNEBB_001911 [Seison nebaliae]